MNYDGYSENKPLTPREDTRIFVPFPKVAVGGVSYRPNKDWNMEFNVDWTDWDTLNTATFKKGSGDTPLRFNWHSSFLYEVGVSRYFGNGYFVSAGYFFSENSIPNRDFIPIIPDTDLHTGTPGVGHKGNRWSWALSYELITSPSRHLGNAQSSSLNGETANGKYDFLYHIVNISVGYHF